ncbi:ABC transporter substrate-binding protein [Aerococcaceae bacterium DSM 111176]|nr:ABC transporter substrate-binding protein [Aerococcaceae bacterium DSM 111176]
MRVLQRIFVGILLIILVLFGIRYSINRTSGSGAGSVINFYNWGDYIDPDVIAEFEEETGYTVVYETFDSNEAMLTKVQQGGTAYDVIVPSEYMVEAMADEGLLLPLDHSKIPNMEHLDPQFLDMAFDQGNQYSLPFFWGTLGIVYNSAELGEVDFNSWDELWNPKYRNEILMIDGAREVLGIGLQSMNYSLNETDDAKLVEAAQKMKRLMPNVMALITDEIKMHLVNGESNIAVTFSGEAMSAIEGNEDLVYVVPDQGSNIWTDNFSIPYNSDNIEGAHALIDFLTRPDISVRNAEYVGYATPNETAFGMLDEEITSDEANYPPDEVIANLEAYQSLNQETLVRYNDLYLEVKIEPRD